MSVQSPTRSDPETQIAVEAELDWTLDVDSASIGVSVDDGVVALSGEVDSYAERVAAKRRATGARRNDRCRQPRRAFKLPHVGQLD